MVCAFNCPVRSRLTDLFAQTAGPSSCLRGSTACCLFLPSAPKLQAPCAVYCEAAVRLCMSQHLQSVAMRIASAVAMGLVPGPHSWVGSLSCHLLLPEPRADETAQECDVCGRPGLTVIPEVRWDPCLQTFWTVFYLFVFSSHSLISSFDYFINCVAMWLVVT